jgi:beta-galactosidase/beta-glucuronidase
MADELGILIWQDMMFSPKFYPYLDPGFIQNSKIEVREQVGRL